jgi:predicted RNase H-like HicB family nuclease
MHRISVIIEKDTNGCYAFAPALPGCQTQGDTLDDALAGIREAVALYLETFSDEELAEIESREILSTTIDVPVAR